MPRAVLLMHRKTPSGCQKYHRAKSQVMPQADSRVIPRPAHAAATQMYGLEKRSRLFSRTAAGFKPLPKTQTLGSGRFKSKMTSWFLISSGSRGAPRFAGYSGEATVTKRIVAAYVQLKTNPKACRCAATSNPSSTRFTMQDQALRRHRLLARLNASCPNRVKARKAQSEPISSALPPIATDARTFLIGSSLPGADIRATRVPLCYVDLLVRGACGLD
jgi:hypothetical protein